MTEADASRFAELGVWSPSEPNAGARLELLRLLVAQGATDAELCDAAPDFDELSWRVSIRSGAPEYTLDEAAERVGVDSETVARIWRTAGLPAPDPDLAIFAEADLETLRTIAAASQLWTEDAALQLTRLTGVMTSRIADAGGSIFAATLAPAFVDDPASLRIAEYNAMVDAQIPRFAQAVENLIRHHMILNSRKAIALDAARTGYETRVMAVGFVDLVGSTELSAALSTRDLGDMLRRFEELAHDIVARHGERLVKLIGDEAMFAALDVPEACAISLALRDAAEHDALLPSVRAGLTTGAVISRDGDCFGPVVNLAARVVAAAEPGTVCTDKDLRDAVHASARRGEFDFQALGNKTFKGFDEPIATFVCERAGDVAVVDGAG